MWQDNAEELIKIGIAELNRHGEMAALPCPCKIGRGERLRVRLQNGMIEVTAQDFAQIYRGLKLFSSGKIVDERVESDYLCAMVDCSRNAVLTVESVKRLIRSLAVMGYNSLQLYTEDTYEIDNHPYFGYLRGRYSKAELKQIVAYAEIFGIEVIPCIQTLAHLRTIFRWKAYQPINDAQDILLVGDERTYSLIEDMFRTLSECFKSRLVNIGMDEAMQLGRGKYLDTHPHRERFELMIEHLKRVSEIAERYGFHPMMWSDMFFRVSDRTGHDYYNDNPLLSEAAEQMPRNIALVYWDYYHKDEDHYLRMIRRHKRFGTCDWFAGGAWKWRGVVPLNAYSIETGLPAIRACKAEKVRNIMITCWGDDGGEGSVFSILPALSRMSEELYGKTEKEAKRDFRLLFDVSYDCFMRIDLPNRLNDRLTASNVSKMYLYNDCFLGVYDKAVLQGAGQRYAEMKNVLRRECRKKSAYAYLFRTEYALVRVLEKKTELGVLTRKFYKEKNFSRLWELYRNNYLPLNKLIKAFYNELKAQWDRENKPFGFDVQDLRLGGLMQRVRHCGEKLKEYLDGKIDRIEELEEEILYYNPETSDRDGTIYYWTEITVNPI